MDTEELNFLKENLKKIDEKISGLSYEKMNLDFLEKLWHLRKLIKEEIGNNDKPRPKASVN